MSVPASMRVLKYFSNRDVRIHEMAVPETGPGELLLKVAAAGICGSDVMEWYRRDKVPLVLGHEIAGEVIAAGAGVAKFKPGDRVAATHHVPCNTCHYCLSGHHTVCETLLTGTNFDPGGFAEYVRIPAINADRGVFPLNKDTSFALASFMEPLACVLRGQQNACLKPGQTVLILGSGISGLLHVALARGLGAGLVIAADTIPLRLRKAEEMGAHLTFPADAELIEKIRTANRGRLADLVVICFEGFIPQALQAVEKGGTVLFFAGASEGATLPAGINDLFWRTEINLAGTYGGSPADCRTALQLLQAGTVAAERTVTHTLSLSEGADGFAMVAAPREHNCIKVIIEPQR